MLQVNRCWCESCRRGEAPDQDERLAHHVSSISSEDTVDFVVQNHELGGMNFFNMVSCLYQGSKEHPTEHLAVVSGDGRREGRGRPRTRAAVAAQLRDPDAAQR